MRNMTELNYEQAHSFVQKNSKMGFFWDNYTIVKWSPGHKGFLQTNGMFRDGQWGYASRFTVTDKGTWFIPDRYVKNT